MSSRVIVITSGKGGVGKTTTTANLGMALANKGEKVVVIDADIGLRNLDLLLGLENRIVYDIVNVVEKSCKVKQALIKHKTQPNLALLPAAQTRDKSSVTPEQMIELCKELENDFTIIIIDCPAGIEQGFKNAIAAAHEALIVTNPELSSIRDADRIIGLLNSADHEISTKLIVNRIRPNMVKQDEMLSEEDVKEQLGVDIIGTVSDDESIIKSTNRGIPAVMDETSVAGKEYLKIAARLLGEDIPLTNIKDEENEGIFSKLKKLFSLK